MPHQQDLRESVSRLISQNMALIKDINYMRTVESELESQVFKLEKANQSAQEKLSRIEMDNQIKLERIRNVLQQETLSLRAMESERDTLKQRIRNAAEGIYSSRGPSHGSMQDLSNEQAACDTSGRSGDTNSKGDKRENKDDRTAEVDGLQSVISSILKGKK